MTPHATRLKPLVTRVPVRGATDWLYERYFIGATERVHTEPSGDAAFVAELAAACDGARHWKRGLVLSRRVGKGAFVDGAPVRLWISSRETGLRPVNARPGREVAVSMPCVMEAPLPGFVGLISRAGPLDHRKPHRKLYVNATPDGAVALFRGLSSLRGARFEAKTLNDPRLFGRRDTALIYVRPEDTRRVSRWLLRFVRANATLFRDDVPPLTKQLARAVGLAESPFDTEESFGSHRCRLIAEGLLTAKRERRAWNVCIAERFERAGLDWDQPWRA